MASPLANLDRLPLDIKRLIIGSSISLHNFLTLRQVSPSMKKYLEENIIALVPDQAQDGEETEEESYLLFPALVMDLKRIEVISPNYPIIVEDAKSLRQLSRHPTLTSAAFALTDDLGPLAEATNLFFSSYPTREPKCQQCPDQPQYNFTFFRMIDDSFSILQIGEGTLSVRNLPPLTRQELGYFYYEITRKVPICHYIEAGSGLNYLDHLPCLTKISLLFDAETRHGQIDDVARDFYQRALFPGIVEYTVSYPKVDDLKKKGTPRRSRFDEFIQNLLSLFMHEIRYDLTYPDVRKFFPVPYDDEYLTIVQEIFPNLTSISLSCDSIYSGNSFVEKDLLDYPTIYLVDDLTNDLIEEFTDETTGEFFGRKYYFLEHIPQEFHERVVMVDSDTPL